MSFSSHGSAQFNWHSFAQLLAWRSLLWLSMTWRQRFLTQKYSSAQHCWPDHWHYIYCFFQSGEAFTVKGNTHTHTYTHTTHTHTHTQTHTCTKWMAPNKCCGIIFWALLRPSTLEYHADCFEKIPEREGSISPATIIFIIFWDSLMF